MLNSGEPLPLGSSAERTRTRDAAGGMANNGQFPLRYDERNRLDRVIVGGLTTTYGVNGLGERTTKDGRPTFGVFEHVYDLSGQLLGIYKSGAPEEEIIWLGALPVGTIQGGAAYSIAPDHLGAPYKIVNSANAQVWFWDHDPFGNGAPTAAAGFWHRLRFPGQVYDSESKLHSNGKRDYDPRLGRYLESDPIGLEGGINTYAYANNIPVNSVDPSGTFVTPETLFDAGNVAMGLYSFDNLFRGNYAAAGIDGLGLGVDVVAAVIPIVPGGAATAIAAGRGAARAEEKFAVVQRWMSKAELQATQETGLLRGGRDGTHYVTDAANADPLRARERLALPQTPEIRVTMEVPNAALSAPSRVEPLFNMPGGGMERTAIGNVPVRIIKVH